MAVRNRFSISLTIPHIFSLPESQAILQGQQNVSIFRFKLKDYHGIYDRFDERNKRQDEVKNFYFTK